LFTTDDHKLADDLALACGDIVGSADLVLEMANRINEIAAGAHGLEDAVRVELTVAKSGNADYGNRRECYRLSAVTDRFATPPGVELRVQADFSAICARTVSILPFILGHEFISHVYAGHGESDHKSPFAEGLMDWVAHHFVAQNLAVIAPALGGGATLCQLEFIKDELARDERKLGWKAGENMAQHLSAVVGGPTDAGRGLAARAATQLNALPASLLRKDRFVLACVDLRRRADLQTALVNYLHGGSHDIQSLLLA